MTDQKYVAANSVAKLKARHEDGRELRYAHKRTMTWPGDSEPLGLAGYWLETSDDLVHLGRSVNWNKMKKLGFKPVDGSDMPSRGNVGFSKLHDEDGRPLQLRRDVRNRITPVGEGGGRLVYKRTIRNIVYVEGKAQWMLEDIPIFFKAVGYCKFPDDLGAGMVALEVMGDKEVGWVRIDPHSVSYKESAS